MNPALKFAPPPHYVVQKRFWRLAKAVVIGVLAIAGGIAWPLNDAEAQGVHDGYTYTQRVCQEYGQQPRWYWVRDPMPGSDWRNDGGWAIVMDRGRGGSRTITTFIRGNNPERTMSEFNYWQYHGGAAHIDNSAGTRSKQQIGSRPVTQTTYGNAYTERPNWLLLNAYQQGKWDGYQGLVVLQNWVPHPGHIVVIDVNKDGNIDAQDAIFGTSNNKLYLLWYTTTEEPAGSSYIRWADLQWCR